MKPGDDFFGPTQGKDWPDDHCDTTAHEFMSKREFVIRFVLTSVASDGSDLESVVETAYGIWKQINEVAPLDG